jgi:hypothetical protein
MMRHRPLAAVLCALAFLAACDGGASPTADVVPAEASADTSTEAVSTTAKVEVSVSDTVTGAIDEALQLDEANVLAAALVIASGGDVEQAILDGSFTAAEVTAAVEALETGTLDHLAE